MFVTDRHWHCQGDREGREEEEGEERRGGGGGRREGITGDSGGEVKSVSMRGTRVGCSTYDSSVSS